MYAVYALVDPRDNKPFYIGITDDIYKRFWQHLNCQGTNYEKNTRIQELRSLNLMVIVWTLETTEDSGYARIREGYWIHHYEMLGCNLANVVRPERELKTKVHVRSTQATKKLVKAELVRTVKFQKPIEKPDERQQILTIAKGQIKKYGRVKRNEIPSLMGKNNRYYPIVKQVLDEEGL